MTAMSCIEIESSRIAWLRRDGYSVEECAGDNGERALRVSAAVGPDEASRESAWFGVDVALDLPTEDYMLDSGVSEGVWWILIPARIVESYPNGAS